MNPLTDKLELDPSGRTIIRPGALTGKSSRNWRLTEDAYNNYAPHLRLGITNYEAGRETSFNVPEGMSPNTFCARFRDAKQALLLYAYDPLLQQRLLALGNVAISMDPAGSCVWFRARNQPGREIKATVDQTKRPIDRTSSITDMPDAEELRSICFLIHKGRMMGPMFFRGMVDDVLREELETKHDVAFGFDEAQNTTTLL